MGEACPPNAYCSPERICACIAPTVNVAGACRNVQTGITFINIFHFYQTFSPSRRSLSQRRNLCWRVQLHCGAVPMSGGFAHFLDIHFGTLLIIFLIFDHCRNGDPAGAVCARSARHARPMRGQLAVHRRRLLRHGAQAVRVSAWVIYYRQMMGKNSQIKINSKFNMVIYPMFYNI